jgi:S-DNA-T family DNA segregation ATPase FtsK/SpoIIIE
MIAPVLAEITDLLPAGLGDRARFSATADPVTPHLVVVMDGVGIPMGNPVLSDEGALGVTLIDLPQQWGQMDDPHTLRIEVGLTPGWRSGPRGADTRIISLEKGETLAVADGLTIAEAEAAARRQGLSM